MIITLDIFSFAFVIFFTFVTFCAYKYTIYKIIPKKSELSFEELITILTITINTQIEIYENSIFKNKNAITNSNYENFYHDLVNHILAAIPESYFDDMGRYLTKESVLEIICRKVHTYLKEKATKIK